MNSAKSNGGAVAATTLMRAARWGAISLTLLTLYLAPFHTTEVSRYYYLTQDRIVAVFVVAVLLAFAFRAWPRIPIPTLRLEWPAVFGLAGALAALTGIGTYLILFNYPLTRDEHMVVFDMAVLGGGRLAAPLPPEWRSLAEALTPAFLLPLPGNAAWVSAYGPGNAALRTMFAALADPAFMNPMLAALGGVALFSVARRVFPDSRSAQAVALLLYLTSAQVIVTAMTTYAMTAHLALNMIWLALFLRGGVAGHGGAMAVGALATGLHQVIFHPLFALPFLYHLYCGRQRRLALGYILVYGAIGLFWFSYPHLVASSAGLVGQVEPTTGAAAFVQERIVPLLLNRDPGTVPLMAFNLLRFAVWQNAALIPLALVAVAVARRVEGIAQPLYYGLLLTIAAMAFLLPYQGHGWGYRYLHGLIGNLALLGAYGWRELAPERPKATALIAAGTLVTLFISLPFLLYRSHSYVKPHAELDAALQKLNVDFVVLDTEPVRYAIDQVRNDPDLRQRPIRLASHRLTPSDVVALCRRGSIAFVSREQMQRLAGPRLGEGLTPPRFRALAAEVSDRRCGSAPGL